MDDVNIVDLDVAEIPRCPAELNDWCSGGFLHYDVADTNIGVIDLDRIIITGTKGLARDSRECRSDKA